MLKIKLMVIGLASILASGCASTSTGTVDASDNRASRNFEFEVVDDKDQVTHICRTERSTGSNIGRRNCRTVEQVEADRAQARADLERAQGPLVSPPPGG